MIVRFARSSGVPCRVWFDDRRQSIQERYGTSNAWYDGKQIQCPGEAGPRFIPSYNVAHLSELMTIIYIPPKRLFWSVFSLCSSGSRAISLIFLEFRKISEMNKISYKYVRIVRCFISAIFYQLCHSYAPTCKGVPNRMKFECSDSAEKFERERSNLANNPW